MELVKGSHVRVVTAESDKDKTDGKIIWVDYPSLPKVLTEGGKIYIDDGLIGLKVTGTGNRHNTDFNKPVEAHLSYLCVQILLLLTYKQKRTVYNMCMHMHIHTCRHTYTH